MAELSNFLNWNFLLPFVRVMYAVSVSPTFVCNGYL
jgi:hypothetical protein